MSNYSKYKERKPEETIFEIQRILRDAGLFTVLQWNERSYEGARANRVTIYPTALGTNGKGTDELYATASAYAELIERLQNGMITLRDRRDGISRETGFVDFPDESLVSAEAIIDDPDPFTAALLPAIGCGDVFSKYACLRAVSKACGCENDMIPVVPFADPTDNRIYQVPFMFVNAITGSNGMSAGNTLEEAMVQGLSELFERAVSKELILGRAVPPLIPDEEVRQYSFFGLIEQIRAEGRYKVELLDCSMGRGWPVAGVRIINLETGRFGIKLGAHPSFAVACERTLTEALQGRNMEMFSMMCAAGPLEAASHYHNYPNVAKTGDGIYPVTMFTSEPDWQYEPWTRWQGMDNRGFLREMLALLREEGLHPLFRDTSFMGFPSCYIIIPGFSEMYIPGRTLYNSIITGCKVIASFDHFPDLSEAEEKRLLRYIEFKQGSVIENQTPFMCCRQLSQTYLLERIGAYLSLKHGEFAAAGRYLLAMLQLAEYNGDEEGSRYIRALAAYASLRRNGSTAEQASALIRRDFAEAAAERVCSDMSDPAEIMKKQFPRMNCYDCDNCEAREAGRGYPEARDVYIRAAKAMKPENVSQERLLQLLTSLA